MSSFVLAWFYSCLGRVHCKNCQGCMGHLAEGAQVGVMLDLGSWGRIQRQTRSARTQACINSAFPRFGAKQMSCDDAV